MTQAPLSSFVKFRRLSLFGHVARMNELANAYRILFAQPPDNMKTPRETVLHLDLKCLQRPVLIWHVAARSQGGSSEPTFLADVNEA